MVIWTMCRRIVIKTGDVELEDYFIRNYSSFWDGFYSRLLYKMSLGYLPYEVATVIAKETFFTMIRKEAIDSTSVDVEFLIPHELMEEFKRI